MRNILIVAIVTVTLMGSTATAAPVGIVNDQSHSATIWVWSPVASAWTKIKVKSGHDGQFEMDASQTAYLIVEADGGVLTLGWLDFTGLIDNSGDLAYVVGEKPVFETYYKEVTEVVRVSYTEIIRGREVTRYRRETVVKQVPYTVEHKVSFQAFFDANSDEVSVPACDADAPPLPDHLRQRGGHGRPAALIDSGTGAGHRLTRESIWRHCCAPRRFDAVC